MELSQTPFSMDEGYLGFLKHPELYSFSVHQLHGSELSKMASRCIELETKALVERRVPRAIDGRHRLQENKHIFSEIRELSLLEDQADHEEMVGESCQIVDINSQRVDSKSPSECSYKYRERPRYISWSSCRSVSYVSDPGGRSPDSMGSPEMAAKQEVKSIRAASPDISEISCNSQAEAYSKTQQALSSKTGKQIHVQVVPCLVHTLRFRNPSEADNEPVSPSCSCQIQAENVPEYRVKRVLAVPELEHVKNRRTRLPPVYTSRSSTAFLFVGVNFVSRFRRVVSRVKSKFRRSHLFEKRLDRKYGFSSVLKGAPPEESSIEDDEVLDTYSPKSSIVTVNQSSSGICQKDEILQLVLPTLSDVFTALLSYHADDNQNEYERAAYNLVEEVCLKKADFFNLAPRWEYLALCVSLDDRLLGEVLWECMLEGRKAVDEYREGRRLQLEEFCGEQTAGHTWEEDCVKEETLDLHSIPENDIKETNTGTEKAESEEGSNEEIVDGNPWQEPSIYHLNPCYDFTSRPPLNHSVRQADYVLKSSDTSKGLKGTSGRSCSQMNDLVGFELKSMDSVIGNPKTPPSDVDDPIEGPLVKLLEISVDSLDQPPTTSPKQALEPQDPCESAVFHAGPSESKNKTTDHPRSSRSLDNDNNSSISKGIPPSNFPPSSGPKPEESEAPSSIHKAQPPTSQSKEPKGPTSAALSRPPTAPSRPTTAYKKSIPGQRIRNIVSQFDSMAVP